MDHPLTSWRPLGKYTGCPCRHYTKWATESSHSGTEKISALLSKEDEKDRLQATLRIIFQVDIVDHLPSKGQIMVEDPDADQSFVTFSQVSSVIENLYSVNVLPHSSCRSIRRCINIRIVHTSSCTCGWRSHRLLTRESIGGLDDFVFGSHLAVKG